MTQVVAIAGVGLRLENFTHAVILCPSERIEDLDNRKAIWFEPVIGNSLKQSKLVSIRSDAETIPVRHDVEARRETVVIEVGFDKSRCVARGAVDSVGEVDSGDRDS